MLTGRLVRVRYARDRILPYYVDPNDPELRETAERMLALFRGQEGRTRGELEDDLRDAFDEGPRQLIYQGLAKLLEDRCEFEVVAGHPPEQLREAAFHSAAEFRKNSPQRAQRGQREVEGGGSG
jgi:predicted nuclease of restriction endonuclease-like RecB superfamily